MDRVENNFPHLLPDIEKSRLSDRHDNLVELLIEEVDPFFFTTHKHCHFRSNSPWGE